MAFKLQVPPGDSTVDDDISRDELAKERARLANELVDAKRKFMAVAKRKQQEYTKKVPCQDAYNSSATCTYKPARVISTHVQTP